MSFLDISYVIAIMMWWLHVLKYRLGNPQIITDAHYHSLSHLPVATGSLL